MKKTIVLLYGVITYVIFLISFLYAIGFVGEFIVPKSINSGPQSASLPSFIINLILLSAFAIQHGIMARPAYKRWVSPVFGPAVERSTFVLMASLILLLLFWKWHPMTTTIWLIDNHIMASIVMGISLFGWIVVVVSTFLIDHFELLGLKQVFNNLKNKRTPNPQFKTNFLRPLLDYEGLRKRFKNVSIKARNAA
ncbi:MAG: hypothetical protein AB8B80_06595 [Marinicellaceae bacterium]